MDKKELIADALYLLIVICFTFMLLGFAVIIRDYNLIETNIPIVFGSMILAGLFCFVSLKLMDSIEEKLK